MIQFNLLPDVKVEYIKARRTKRTVVLTSALVGGASILAVVLLFVVVNVVQKHHLSSLQDDIAQNKKTLSEKPDLAKVLTIQNQLNSLPALHKQKPVASRLFGYVQQLTPQNVSISGLTVDFAAKTIKIDGATDSLATVNTFVDTLKFTNYISTDPAQPNAQASTPAPAFSQVVLASFSVASATATDKNKASTYSITLKYDQVIFDSAKNVTLQVNKQVTTRSETEKPGTLFQSNPTTNTTIPNVQENN